MRVFAAAQITKVGLFTIRHCSGQKIQSPVAARMAVGSGVTATPSRNVTVLPEIAGTRSPGTITPTRLSGSAAERVMASPGGAALRDVSLRNARSDSTATGN